MNETHKKPLDYWNEKNEQKPGYVIFKFETLYNQDKGGVSLTAQAHRVGV
jgi:hypothetical protein